MILARAWTDGRFSAPQAGRGSRSAAVVPRRRPYALARGWRAALSRRGQLLELLLLDDEALDDEVLDEELVALLLGLGFAAARESVR